MRALLLVSLAAGCGFRGPAIGGDGGAAGDAPRGIDASTLLHDGPNVAADSAQDAPPMAPDAHPDAAPLTCPITTGWVTISGKHYYYSPDGDDKHWSAAESDCEQRGSGFSATHLAVINSMQEGIDVGGGLVQVGQAVGGVMYAWIGMFQPILQGSKSAGWLEITSATTYANWSNGEPNDGSMSSPLETSMENFAELYQPGTMNDTPGSQNLHYICECDGISADLGTALLVPLN